jgi:hypothetical protein
MKKRIEKIVMFLLLWCAGIFTLSIFQGWMEEQETWIEIYELDIRAKRALQKRNIYYDRARESLEPIPELLPDKKGPLTIEDITLFS